MTKPNKVRVGNHHMPLPASRLARIVLGGLLIIGGALGFLPVLGFWMIPLGALVLSVDLPVVRRWRRRLAVRLGTWLKPRWPWLAGMFGFSNGNGSAGNGRRRGGRR